jgi:hypothetical protein
MKFTRTNEVLLLLLLLLPKTAETVAAQLDCWLDEQLACRTLVKQCFPISPATKRCMIARGA